ncbi:MAG: hypothetical protein OHK0046_12420 [Anaerolineae bacterium]
MLVTLLLLIGAVLTAWLLGQSFWRVARQQPPLRHQRWLLLVLDLVLLLTLIAENISEAVFDREELFVFIVAGLFMLGSLVLMFTARRQPDQQANARIGAVMGLGLVLLAFIIPVLSAGADLPGQIASLPTPTPGPTQTMNDRARSIFDQVVEIIAAQTGDDYDTIARELDAGVTVADMVRAQDGDLEEVVRQIDDLLTAQVQILASEGRMTDALAAVTLSQMELIVRLGVEQDLAGSLARFEDNPLDEE